MDVYEAAKFAREWVKENTPANVAHWKGCIGILNGEVLKFESVVTARQLGGSGYIFSFIFRNGNITIECEN